MRALAVRAAMAFAAIMMATLVSIGALGFAAAALYLALLQVLSPPLAALLTAIILLVVALLILSIVRLLGRSPSASPPSVEAAAAARAVDLGQMAATLLTSRARTLWHSHARDAVALTFAAGLVIGLSPRLRRALWRSLRDPPDR